MITPSFFRPSLPPLCLVVLLLLCNSLQAQSALPADTLEPADLGITKHVLGVNCAPGEAAVITVTNQVSDQAPKKWKVVVKETGGHVQESVLVIDRSFFKPEAKGTYTVRLPGHVITVEGVRLLACETDKKGPQWTLHFIKNDAPAEQTEPAANDAGLPMILTVEIDKKPVSQLRSELPDLPAASNGKIRYVSPEIP